jgi:hypothetical protein
MSTSMIVHIIYIYPNFNVLSENKLIEIEYELDYQAMSKLRSNIIRNELQHKVFPSARVSKWIDYFCENGGNIVDFDWAELC